MTLEEQYSITLQDVRNRNARQINRFCALGVGAFTVALPITGKEWQPIFIPTAIYFVIVLVVMIGGESNSKILRASRFAVPILDMPMVFAIQL
jgi:hypothetical protein